jgi:hypothetical protein
MRKLIGVLGVVLVVAPSALASGSTTSGYGGSAGVAQATVQKTGTLPFTGLSLTGVLLAGLLLVAVGVVIRRKGRPSA